MQTATAAAIAAPVIPAVSTWAIDTAHSEVGFRVRHMMVSWTKGRFDTFQGTLELNEQDLAKSKLEVRIEAKSINTGNTDRDNHLRSPDFFDAAQFPALTYVSHTFEPGKDGGFRVLGELTLHGVSKAVALDVEEFTSAAKDPYGNVKRGARAHAKLNRKDFGLSWNAGLEMGGVLVGDTVEITLEVELAQK